MNAQMFAALVRKEIANQPLDSQLQFIEDAQNALENLADELVLDLEGEDPSEDYGADYDFQEG